MADPNPLLKPVDPRFQPRSVVDEDGKNRFAEDAAAPADPAGADPGDQPYAPAASERPFQPRYESHQSPRLSLLWVLCAGGWGAAILGTLSLTGLLSLGWLAPLLGLGPAAAAWLIAYEDLKAIAIGAIDERHFASVQKACWVGAGALVACAALVGLMIYNQMRFLPDVF